MTARKITTGRELVQALQDFESALWRIGKLDALAQTHAGTATGRRHVEAAAREHERIQSLRARLHSYANTLPD